MKITEVNTVKNKIKIKKPGASSGPAFSSFIDESDKAEETQATQNISPIAAVAIINEVEEINPEEKRKQTIQHGHDILDELEELRNSLLLGTLNEQALQSAYNKALANRDKTDDPRLEDVVNEIETRAAVELAKLGLL